jgi:hypothetical protein
MSLNHEGVFIGWWRTKFEIFRIFFRIFGVIRSKTACFSVQTVEFIFKQSNFNSNRPITNRRVTTVRQSQRQAVVRVIPLDATARLGSNTDDTT